MEIISEILFLLTVLILIVVVIFDIYLFHMNNVINKKLSELNKYLENELEILKRFEND